MAYSPAQRAIARRIAQTAPGSNLDALLVATAIVESNLTPTAVGDGGRSHGVFQEYDLGRGSGIPISGRRNVEAATERAYREFQTFFDRGARGPSLAYRAQRPANQADYIRKISAALPAARELIGGQGAGTGGTRDLKRRVPADNTAGQAALGGGRKLTPRSIALIQQYADQTRAEVMSGAPLSSSKDLAPRLQFVEQAAAASDGGDHAGHDHGGGGGGGGGGRAALAGRGARLLPGAPQWGSFGYGDPEGQGGKHLAVDWFADHGTVARSPVAGRIVRLTPHQSGNRTLSGQVYGGVLAIRDEAGRLHVMRHIDPSTKLRQGIRIAAGAPIGTPTRWSGSDHIHYETYRPGSSDREYGAQYAINPRDVLRSLGVFS